MGLDLGGPGHLVSSSPGLKHRNEVIETPPGFAPGVQEQQWRAAVVGCLPQGSLPQNKGMTYRRPASHSLTPSAISPACVWWR